MWDETWAFCPKLLYKRFWHHFSVVTCRAKKICNAAFVRASGCLLWCVWSKHTFSVMLDTLQHPCTRCCLPGSIQSWLLYIICCFNSGNSINYRNSGIFSLRNIQSWWHLNPHACKWRVAGAFGFTHSGVLACDSCICRRPQLTLSYSTKLLWWFFCWWWVNFCLPGMILRASLELNKFKWSPKWAI